MIPVQTFLLLDVSLFLEEEEVFVDKEDPISFVALAADAVAFFG
jgi:hypothetical protein